MLIQLNEKYAIISDTHSFALAEKSKKIDKRHKEWKMIAWFSTLEMLLINGYVERRLREIPDDALDILSAVKEIRTEIRAVLGALVENIHQAHGNARQALLIDSQS